MNDNQRTVLGAEAIKSIVKHAVHAPSSHNTQPWRFQITEKTVTLFADRTRALPANDPEDRELTISCGCALMNLRVAAAQTGLVAKVGVLPGSSAEDLLATVAFDQPGSTIPPEAELFHAIDARRTYRKRFAPREVPSSVVQALCEAAATEGAWFQVVDTEEQRHEVAALVAEGDARQWANPSWRRELAAWMHPRRRGDGLALPGLIVPAAQIVVRIFDLGGGVGAKDKRLADGSPVLAVLGTDGDGKSDWLQAGQALERILLTACGKGVQGSFLNQPIQIASLRSQLQHLLGGTGFPQILLRLGYPEGELPPSPRRTLEEVIGQQHPPQA